MGPRFLFRTSPMNKGKQKTILYGLTGFCLVFFLFLLAGCQEPAEPISAGYPEDGQAAKALLAEGNRRYVEGNLLAKDVSVERRESLLDEQKPVAVILACSDSRVPPEIIFDQGLGQIFVVRTAGNVLDSVTLGSLEYAVEHFQAPLIVVLGHDNCGAVHAVVEGGVPHGSIAAIVRKIQPSVDKAKKAGAIGTDIDDQAIDSNIKNTINELKKSIVIRQVLTNNEVSVVGARYNLESGEVKWLE